MVGVLFGTLAVCLVLTVPIAISLAVASAAVFAIGYAGTPMMNMLAQSMVTSMNSYPLMAIPFFMLLGGIMEKMGIAKKIIDVGEAFAGDAPGGLGAAAIIACMFFAAISGSGPACVAAIGAIMIPSMTSKGYEPGYSGALLAAGSTIGPVIPPSIPMIVYGATIGVSVSTLFVAGVIPGIGMGIALILINFFISKKRGYRGAPRVGGIKGFFKKILGAFWAILMPIIVLGGIYAGIFTPTESAVVGVFYALAVGIFIYHEATFQKIYDGLIESAVMSASVMVIMGGASTFGRLLTLEKIPQMIAAAFLSVSDSPLVILLLINLSLLVAGCFIDTISNIILFAPLFVPIIVQLGYSPLYFGIIMTVNLCIGMITPPLGVNLFVAKTIANTSFDNVVKGIAPFLIALIVLLLILVLFPQITLFLPQVLGMI